MPLRAIVDDDLNELPPHVVNLPRIADITEAKQTILGHWMFEDILQQAPYQISAGEGQNRDESGHKAGIF